MQPRAQPAFPAAFPAGFPEVSAFLQHLFVHCLDVHAVWLLDAASSHRRHELLVIADRHTLERLRTTTDLHRADLDVLVVIDGDAFESAWGLRKVSGSLGRWAWRQVSEDEAYYDESGWAEHGGSVVRTRRQARLLWEAHHSIPA